MGNWNLAIRLFKLSFINSPRNSYCSHAGDVVYLTPSGNATCRIVLSNQAGDGTDLELDISIRFSYVALCK